MDEQPIVNKPKPPTTPKLFSGVQGVVLIVVLIAGVVGWVLYFNSWTKAAPEAEDETPEQAEEITYIPMEKTYEGEAIALSDPATIGTVSVEKALSTRRSARAFTDASLTEAQLSQMLWAAQGVTDDSGHRTAPSAKGLYAINLYVVVRNVAGVEAGLYHYLAEEHSIRLVKAGDSLLLGEDEQDSVKNAPAVLVYGAIYSKVQADFGEEGGIKVTLQESGHIGENVYLQAETLGLGTVVVGGFSADSVRDELKLAENETVIYLQPFGLELE
ncbi:MAG: SagB/ThcOx family dehydrogenase [Candidatus Kerfeldbacteria bacterium]